nr:unnamed protein product [Digitaria exilis]
MGARLPQVAALFAAFLAVSFGAAVWRAEAAAAPPVVVGSIKCLDCSLNGVNAEDAFQGLQVAIKCKSGGADETYETKAVGPLDDAGVFRIPLAAELLRDDGNLDHDCFAQLHTAPDTPCVGQAPPRIAPATQDDTTTTTYLAAAADTVFSPVACACGKKKKHFMFGPPPPPPRPTPNPPTPTYGPPTPTPAYGTPTPTYGPPMPMPTPVPEPRPPAPEEPEPEPFFKKKPKMKLFHKKKPCPPLVDDEGTARPAAGEQEKLSKKLN